MQLIRLLILIIGIYLAYRFVFDFLIPVYRTSKRMHQQFRGMQDQMNQQMNNTHNNHPKEELHKRPAGEKLNKKDYIDFEEIK